MINRSIIYNMKSQPHKFINRLSSDIVQQNYHLKEQIIKAKQSLKNFEQKMIQQLISSDIHISKKNYAYSFESAQECLNQFVELISQNHQEIKQIKNAIKQTTHRNSILIEQNQELKVSKHGLEEELGKLKSEYEQLKEQFKRKGEEMSNIIFEKENRIKELVQKVVKVKVDSEEEIERMSVHYMNEMKTLIENTNHQKIHYRKKLEGEAWQTEKGLKAEIDKKDRDIKNMMNTIASIFEKNEIPSETVTFLKSVIKPFLDHTALNEKISELRRENIQIKNQLRQLNTKNIDSESKIKQLQTENNILGKLIDKTKKQNEKCMKEYERMKQEFEECKEDKNKMQEYYDDRWQRQFAAVKENLQKRYNQKVSIAEQSYHEKKCEIQQIKKDLIKDKHTFISKISKLEAQVNQLQNKLKQEKFKVEARQIQIKQIKKQYFEVCMMNKQEVQMIKYNSKLLIESYKSVVLSHERKIQNLQDQKRIQKQKYQQKIITLISSHEEETEKIRVDLELKHKQQLQQKNQQIFRGKLKIDEYLKHIDEIKKQYILIIQEQRTKILTRKEIEKEQMKSQIQKQLIREKEVNIQLNLRLADLKKSKSDDLEEYHQTEKRFQREIKQKEKIFHEYQRQLKSIQNVNRIYEEDSISYKDKIQTLQRQKKSLQVLLNSRQLQIMNLNNEIRQYLQQRKQWLRNIDQCKKQYEEGFTKMKQVCQQRVNYYKSRIWELERVAGHVTNKKDMDRIRSLTEDKKKLEQKVNMKQAQNLILKEVKGYYETRVRDSDSKMMIAYELKQQSHPIMVKRPRKKKIKDLRNKTYLQLPPQDQDISDIKKYIERQKTFKEHRDRNYRTNSSIN